MPPKQLHVQIFDLSIVKLLCSFNLLSEKGNNYFYNIISCELQKVWLISVFINIQTDT